MPSSELLIAAGPGEWRAVLCEGGAAVELHVERGEGAEAGSIHLGRVVKRLPALAALLVDIGGDRPVFLPARDVLPRGWAPDEGERLVLQVRSEALGGKSARGTMRLALRRGSIEPVGEAELAGAAGQTPLSAQIRDRARSLTPPVRLHPPATFAAALAGALRVTPLSVVVDEAAAIPEVRAAFPDTPVHARPEVQWPIDLDALFDAALTPTVVLGGGAAVHIEPTRAAVLIDVDSGSPPGGAPESVRLAADLAAAAAVAREIRLRNLGGGIVVDFIGLDRPRAREQVKSALAEALAHDPARPQIHGWTRLGHLELTRPRYGRPLADALLERGADAGRAKSSATVAHEALRALRRAARAEPGRNWKIVAAPEVAAALAGPLAGARRTLETSLARGVAVTAEPSRPRERFDIVAR